MHNHLEEGDGGNSNIFEVMGIGFPWLFLPDEILFLFIVTVQSVPVGIDELDAVLELCFIDKPNSSFELKPHARYQQEKYPRLSVNRSSFTNYD